MKHQPSSVFALHCLGLSVLGATKARRIILSSCCDVLQFQVRVVPYFLRLVFSCFKPKTKTALFVQRHIMQDAISELDGRAMIACEASFGIRCRNRNNLVRRNYKNTGVSLLFL